MVIEERQVYEKHYVFQIQHYSVHDGPGIRTILFMKGCPLRCKWCCNPESQSPLPQFFYEREKCIGKDACGWCLRALDNHGISQKSGVVTFDSEQKAVILHPRFPKEAVKCCPSEAISLRGKEYSIDELLDIVSQDEVFYTQGKGGLTVSGGEPLCQGDFLTELLKEAKKRHIHTAIETCGYGDYEVLKNAAKYLDYIMYDIKSMDEEKHRAFTGKSNHRILKNFEQLCKDYPELPKKVRTPVIPGFNDSVEDVQKIMDFLKGKAGVDYEPLPYHRFGAPKYACLGRKYPMGDVRLDQEVMIRIQELVNGSKEES